MRFHSAPVIRLVDAKPVQLGHAAGADGAWRIYVFADSRNPQDPASRIGALCKFLDTDKSPITRFTPSGADIDSVIDVRAIFQQGHRDLAVTGMPPVLLPRKGRFGLIDYEKMFCPDLKAGTDIFEMRGVNREQGCMVVVRPDQYIAHVLPLHGFDALAEFFAGFMIEARCNGLLPAVLDRKTRRKTRRLHVCDIPWRRSPVLDPAHVRVRGVRRYACGARAAVSVEAGSHQ